jgi:hypothetical protein
MTLPSADVCLARMDISCDEDTTAVDCLHIPTLFAIVRGSELCTDDPANAVRVFYGASQSSS